MCLACGKHLKHEHENCNCKNTNSLCSHDNCECGETFLIPHLQNVVHEAAYLG